MQAIGLGYKSVAHFLIATHRASSVNSSSVDNNKLPSAKSETSCISDHANESPEDGETTSKAKQNKATRRRVRKSSDGDNDSRSGSVVTSDCQDDQANKDAGCVTPSSKPASTKRKYVERSPDCIASRLRSRLNMPWAHEDVIRIMYLFYCLTAGSVPSCDDVVALSSTSSSWFASNDVLRE